MGFINGIYSKYLQSKTYNSPIDKVYMKQIDCSPIGIDLFEFLIHSNFICNCHFVCDFNLNLPGVCTLSWRKKS